MLPPAIIKIMPSTYYNLVHSTQLRVECIVHFPNPPYPQDSFPNELLL